MRRPPARLLLAAVLATAGVAHFAAPKGFDDIVPEALGNPRAWTYFSGVAELTGAALLARKETAKWGGWYAAALFVGVFPANVNAAVEGKPPWDNKVVAYGRLPLQIPLVIWAVYVARQAQKAAALPK